MLEAARQCPLSAWRQLQLKRVTRAFRTPRVLDQTIALRAYEGPLRQLIVAGLGHEDPTFLLTNQLRRSPATLFFHRIQIADGIDFFHMDGRAPECQLRSAADLDGQQPLSALPSALAMATNRPSPATCSGTSLTRSLGSA